MRCVTARTAVAALVAGLLSPLPLAATATPAKADTYGHETVVAGGGDGLSGPASRARLQWGTKVDAASDGSVLVADHSRVLRLQPSSDAVAVVPGSAMGDAHWIVDVAASGSAVVVATDTGVKRIADDGSTAQLLTQANVQAVDVGADGVVWAATQTAVFRIQATGTVQQVTTQTSHFQLVQDLVVTPDGATAYVADDGGSVGVFAVTSAGIGARVAGNGTQSGSYAAGYPATSVTTNTVRGLATDGTTIILGSPSGILRFAIGGLLSQPVSRRWCFGITLDGAELVAACQDSATNQTPYLRRFSATGADLGRILGADPSAPWSPDGVDAADAYLDAVKGAAALPDGRTVFTTVDGLVREVRADGTLGTRATLAPFRSRGKVALAADGTAYVITDAGGVVMVPVTGAPVPLTIDADADAVDVEADDDWVIVADARGNRLLRMPRAGGDATVLSTLVAPPKDIGLDGSTVLVADAGLRRVAADGTASTLLSGGNPTIAAAAPGGGVWSDPGYGGNSDQSVLLPDGGRAPVRVELMTYTRPAQVQAVGNGTVAVSGDQSVRLVTDAGLPEATPFSATAAPGEGQIVLGWDDSLFGSATVIAKAGPVPPADQWDGVAVAYTTLTAQSAQDGRHAVLRVGDHVLQAGEQWSFAVFGVGSAPISNSGVVSWWSAPAKVTATVLADDTPPGAAINPRFGQGRTTIFLSWTNPSDIDLADAVVRFALGTTAPATPDDGTAIPHTDNRQYPSLYVPDPVPDQDYAVSIFTVDLHGNYSRWSGIARLDTTPPAQVTDLQIVPAYLAATVSFTPPTDPDFDRVLYAMSPGSVTPSLQNATSASGTRIGLGSLTMDRQYTVAAWSVDHNGNVSAPVIQSFTTLLDTQPPGPVTGLSATGGPSRATASWTPPTDSDLARITLTLTDDTGHTGTPISLAKTATSYTWSGLPGGRTFTIRATAQDANGLISSVATTTVVPDFDSNGPPPPIAPSTVSFRPTSPDAIAVSFPRPTIPDLKTVGFALIPAGQDPKTVSLYSGAPTSSATISFNATLPQPPPAGGYQLVLAVWDVNSNRATSVVPGIIGSSTNAHVPSAPATLVVAAPTDNALDVQWTASSAVDPATSWTITAVSGPFAQTVTVPGSTGRATLSGVVGDREWTVTVVGTNASGAGPGRAADPVAVSGAGPSPSVTRAVRTPGYDTELLQWRNPVSPDFDHVEITRRGATPAESTVIYRGRSTLARAVGLVPGRSYSFEIATFYRFGHTPGTPVTVTTIQSSVNLTGATSTVPGGTISLAGTLAWNGGPAAGRQVGIQSLPAGSSLWRTVATAITTASGTFSASVHPVVATRYRAAYLGYAGTGGCFSPVSTVTLVQGAKRPVPAQRRLARAW